MVASRNEKLNRLQHILPEGLVVDTTWLNTEGYPKSLRDKYLASGWLEHVSRSLYRRPVAKLAGSVASSQNLEWEHVVLSLQNLMGSDVSVGGRTALELQGFAHYLPAQGPREVHLYSDQALPGWLATVPVRVNWDIHKSGRLVKSGGRDLTVLKWGHWNWPLTLSTAERAVLELLDELPNRESFDQVDALVNGLTTLRPRRLQKLLETCQSIKVKRLFMFFAERHNHAWFKQLDQARIGLGTGKRALVEHGRYDPKYQITVPNSLLERPHGL